MKQFYEISAPYLVEHSVIYFNITKILKFEQVSNNSAKLITKEIKNINEKSKEPEIILIPGLRDWISENCKHAVYVKPDGIFQFESDEDKIWFCLKWIKNG